MVNFTLQKFRYSKDDSFSKLLRHLRIIRWEPWQYLALGKSIPDGYMKLSETKVMEVSRIPLAGPCSSLDSLAKELAAMGDFNPESELKPYVLNSEIKVLFDDKYCQGVTPNENELSNLRTKAVLYSAKD